MACYIQPFQTDSELFVFCVPVCHMELPCIHNADYINTCMPVCSCRLFTYPAPPAVGGITVTNEDLYCLNDGEFLNDVVIEFYIK